MDDPADRVFRWIWRLNGAILLLLCVGFLVMMAAAGIGSHRAASNQPAQVAGQDLRAEDLRLGDFAEVKGGSLLYAALAAPSEYGLGSVSSSGFGCARNLLFFDQATGRSHWLLPSNDHAIRSYQFLTEPVSSERYGVSREDGVKRVTIALLAEVLPTKDCFSGESRPGRRILMASADGRQVTPLIDPVDALLGYHHAAKDSLFLFYVSGGAARVAHVDPATRKVHYDRLMSAEE